MENLSLIWSWPSRMWERRADLDASVPPRAGGALSISRRQSPQRGKRGIGGSDCTALD